MTPDTGTITKPTNTPGAATGSPGERVFDVDGYLFRFDPSRPDGPASTWHDGRWERITLTGDDICLLARPRPVGSEELAARLVAPGSAGAAA
jgi:hypothetical protein